jgi:hypothetical protein
MRALTLQKRLWQRLYVADIVSERDAFCNAAAARDEYVRLDDLSVSAEAEAAAAAESFNEHSMAVAAAIDGKAFRKRAAAATASAKNAKANAKQRGDGDMTTMFNSWGMPRKKTDAELDAAAGVVRACSLFETLYRCEWLARGHAIKHP